MKNLIAFASLSFALAAACCGSAHASVPRIEIVGGDTVDLGRVRPGRYTRAIAIANIGTDTLRITAINSGCGCLVGAPDRTTLGAGDTALVQITVETGGQVIEHWSKALAIASNDPLRPVVEVIVRASFRRDIRLTTVINTFERARCDSVCMWLIEFENVSDSALIVKPPFVEEMRGVSVEFDMTEARSLARHERLMITGRVTVLGGEAVPSARVLIITSGEFDPERSLAWFYLPSAQ